MSMSARSFALRDASARIGRSAGGRLFQPCDTERSAESNTPEVARSMETRCGLASAKAAELESTVFQEEGLDPQQEGSPYHDVHLKGERRPYRFPLVKPRLEVGDEGLWAHFELPRGCYATTVMAEIMKTE